MYFIISILFNPYRIFPHIALLFWWHSNLPPPKNKTNLKQINNKKTLVNLYKDIVLVTRVRIFCTTLFTNNNIKIVVKSHTFLFHLYLYSLDVDFYLIKATYNLGKNNKLIRNILEKKNLVWLKKYISLSLQLIL